MTMGEREKQWERRSILKRGETDPNAVDDAVAIEEPLEIRIAGETVAVTMRSPGQDDWLTAGFLLSEGIISTLGDVSRIYHCGRPGTETFRNTIDVIPSPGLALDLPDLTPSKRGTLTSSACGVCGRQSIDDLLERCEPFEGVTPIDSRVVTQALSTIQEHQPTFEATGGVHAAAIFTDTGALVACSEDIGRHNAVDKVVGSSLYEEDWPEGALLAVSGRASFEMIQKAAMARLPYVVSVSAASTLAVDLADRMNMTVIGFARRGRMNVYTYPERLQ